MSFSKTCSAILMALGLLAVASPARAALIEWDINGAASYMRLNIADQAINLDGTNLTIRLRDASSTSQWTDAGGRRTFLDGTLTSIYTNTGVNFLGGQHNMEATSVVNLRPNPASWNPAATNADNPDGTYTNTSTAPADFGARVRASISFLTVDAAFLAFRDVFFDLAANIGGLTNYAGVIGANTTALGIETALIDLDGLSISLVGQPIPDTRAAPISLPNSTNVAGGVITIPDPINQPLLRQMTLTVNIPISIDLEGTIINGSATGVLVATAIVPEPSTMVMAGFAAFGLCWAGRRRFRRS